MRKLLVRMGTDGGAVVHGLRGRAPNRQIDEQLQARAIELLIQLEWHDFGPTFASQQLAQGVTFLGGLGWLGRIGIGWFGACGL